MNKRLHSSSGSAAAAGGERGFSLLKLLVGLALAGFILFNGGLVMYAYYTNSKVQHCFDGLVGNSRMAHADAAVVRNRLNELMSTQYIDAGDLPQAFFDHLNIRANGDMLEISSHYGVTVWPLGKVQAVDADGSYDPDALTGMDRWRDKARIDLEFEPYAISSAASPASTSAGGS